MGVPATRPYTVIMMKGLVKELIFLLADVLGINFIFRRLTGGEIRVLMYHGVASRPLPTDSWTRLDRDKFRLQMDHLKRCYRVVSPACLPENQPRLKGAVVITFDDGLKNVYSDAWPILKERGLRAICFVLPALSERGELVWPDDLYGRLLSGPCDHLDWNRYELGHIRHGHDKKTAARDIIHILKSRPHSERTAFLDYLRRECPLDDSLKSEMALMTPDEIKELAESDEFEIGPHTDTHPILSTMSPDQQEKEIADSINRIESWGIEPVPLFAYPNGRPEDFNEATIEILVESGVKAAVSTQDGFHSPADDRYRINRIPVGADMSRREFNARLSGFFYFLKQLTGRPRRRG